MNNYRKNIKNISNIIDMTTQSKEVLEAVIRAAEHAKIIKGDGGIVKSRLGNILSYKDSYIDAFEFIRALKDELK